MDLTTSITQRSPRQRADAVNLALVRLLKSVEAAVASGRLSTETAQRLTLAIVGRMRVPVAPHHPTESADTVLLVASRVFRRTQRGTRRLSFRPLICAWLLMATAPRPRSPRRRTRGSRAGPDDSEPPPPGDGLPSVDPAIHERYLASRRAQGLPPGITDPEILAKVVSLLRGSRP